MNNTSCPQIPMHRNYSSKSVTSLQGIRPLKLPPQTSSAPTTFRRRRRHVAEQVYVTSTSIPYLSQNNFIDNYEKGDNTSLLHNDVDDKNNTAYYNTSSYTSDDLEDSSTNIKRYAAFRSVSTTDTVESQEVTLFLETLSESYNHYDYLHSDEDFDSFDSESDSEIVNINQQNDSGVDMGNYHLLDTQGNSTTINQIYGLTRFVASAGKHMKRLRRNWSLNKNDITKSLSRITKNKSTTTQVNNKIIATKPPPLPTVPPPLIMSNQLQITKPLKPSRPPPPIPPHSSISKSINNILITPNVSSQNNQEVANIIDDSNSSSSNKINVMINTVGRKKNWLKFRRAFSMTESTTNESMKEQNGKRSTFYLTSEIDADLEADIISSDQSLQSSEQPDAIPACRRLQNIVKRPENPPPPIPTIVDKKRASIVEQNEKVRSTSWYTECGLFKESDLKKNMSAICNTDVQTLLPPSSSNILQNINQKSHTCWYAEVGLYQQAGSIGGSTSTSSNQDDDALRDFKKKIDYNQKYYNDYRETNVKNENWCYYNKEFDDTTEKEMIWKDEPLYQFYDAALIDDCEETSSDNDYESYEEIPTEQYNENSNKSRFTPSTKSPVISRLSKYGRTLWCEIPEVIQSQILYTLTSTQKKLQEVKFEIITSEASYLNSLKVLEEHFMKNLELFLNTDEKQILFGNVKPVRECSERLLADLESCWESSMRLTNICSVIYHHCVTNFNVYIRYCINQVQLDVTLKRCKGDLPPPGGGSPPPHKNKTTFLETLKKLEANPTCQSLSLYSFLMLPMQRITRLPLLIDAVLNKLTPNDDEFDECQKCLRAVNEIVMRCNEGAREAERFAEVQRIAAQLEYSPNKTPIIFAALQEKNNNHNNNNNNFVVKRWLVKSGDLTQLVARGAKVNDDSIPLTKLTFGKRFTKLPISLFLFEDMLIVARKKNDDKYLVLHHCPRSFVEVSTSTPDSSGTTVAITPTNISNNLLLFLTLLENQDARTVELMLSCSTETDRQRWLEALRPPSAEEPGETIYESWDCPQVRAVHQYHAGQPDELGLTRGDVVNVEKKMVDGWYYGTRLRDGISGWFPGNHTLEIANPHVRARNLRQRYRLLAFTDTYLNKNK